MLLSPMGQQCLASKAKLRSTRSNFPLRLCEVSPEGLQILPAHLMWLLRRNPEGLEEIGFADYSGSSIFFAVIL